MKKTLITALLAALLCSCSHPGGKQPAGASPVKKVHARITYYHPEAPWYKKVSDQTVKTACEGVTVAAHPDFHFGTKVHIPALKNKLNDGNFVVQDRGSAVTKKTAAKGKGYVFDVYVTNRSKLNFFANHTDMWSDVYILN